jgi:tetratricopeptide (TPR) repeat protein
MNNNFDEFIELTNRCMKFAYTRSALARCYRNLGYYYIEQNNYDLAIALYLLSLEYEPDQKSAQSELFYVSTKTGIDINKFGDEDIMKILKSNSIQIGATDLVVGVAYNIGEMAQENNNIDHARFYYNIVYELTKDESIKELIDKL